MNARYNVGYSIVEMFPPIPGKCSCGCGEPLPKGRRRWLNDEHSNKCVRLFLIRKGDSGTVRAALFERDRGVCARCKTDTEQEQRIWRDTFRLWMWLAKADITDRVRAGTFKLTSSWREDHAIHLVALNEVGGDIRRASDGRYSKTGHAWEAHHKVAVVEGGGGCDLDGYETLCLPCHKEETRALRRRLAKPKNNAFQRTMFGA